LSLFSGKREDRDQPKPATQAPAPSASAADRPQTHREECNMANIGKSISIRGDLTGNEDMVIEGQVEGKVDLPNNQLTVGADGKVKAEIHAKSVVVVGRVDGNIFGLERIEIQATGRVEGDVTAPKLVVAEGAQLNGAIKMSQQGNRAESAKPEKATAATSPEVRKAG
jgi:cytoskeletal protein CcmA (bactofilin family)